jgi:hypothetical protein
LEAQVRQFLFPGLQLLRETDDCRAKTRSPCRISFAVFPSKYPSITPAEMIILRVDSLSLWKIISEEDASLIPKTRGRRKFSSGLLHSEFFEGLCGVSRYAATPFIVSLYPGYVDIIRLRPWSPAAT